MFVKMFNLSLEQFQGYNKNFQTCHCKFEREERLENIEKEARPVKNFIAVVDKGHKNGPEVHALFSDGSIRIYNFESHKLITILFARIGQAKRIMDEKQTDRLPSDVFERCMENLYDGKNYI